MSDVEPSAPLIAYLFADRLLSSRPARPQGTHVPCSDEYVQTQPLAVLLFATAFWSLRERALIAMDVADDPGTRWHVHHVAVNVKRLDTASRPGLEGAVMDNLEEEGTLCDVVCRWSSLHSNNPWHDVIEEEKSEALSAGYLRAVTENNSGVLARLLGNGTELESDCSKIAGLETQFHRFHGSWKAFEEKESTFYDHLTADCKRSLLTCTECWYP
jgi:hypothetical protein